MINWLRGLYDRVRPPMIEFRAIEDGTAVIRRWRLLMRGFYLERFESTEWVRKGTVTDIDGPVVTLIEDWTDDFIAPHSGSTVTLTMWRTDPLVLKITGPITQRRRWVTGLRTNH